jgi:hypothetical protein
MVPMAMFGAAFTMLLPLTDRRSLEELTSPEMNMDIDVPDDLFFEDGNEEGWDGILGEEGNNILEKYSSVRLLRADQRKCLPSALPLSAELLYLLGRWYVIKKILLVVK